jgi:parallel beta-helix repeat protein
MLLLVGMLALSFNIQPVKTEPTAIVVPDDYPTIQEAINAASPGDTIYVKEGMYYENVVINKTISVIGENRDTTIIDGRGIGSVISVEASNVTIRGFRVQNSGTATLDSGIRIQLAWRARIEENSVVNCDNGILAYLLGGNHLIRNNIVTSCQHGIFVQGSFDNVIGDNTLTKNNFSITLQFCSGNIIDSNNVSYNIKGIYLYTSMNNTLTRNNIANNEEWGILMILTSTKNTIVKNNVVGNDYGIYCSDSYENVYHHNNFIANHHQAYFSGYILEPNLWHDSLSQEGNYWSDYDGTDTNEDGVGDSGYRIDKNNRDDHPLMGTFSEFSVTHEGAVYSITTICSSLISNFQFDISKNVAAFNIEVKDELVFCRICFPKAILSDSLNILINGHEPLAQRQLSMSNSTHAFIYFTYGPPGIPFWVQWWFWTMLGFGIVVVVLTGLFMKRRKVKVDYYKEGIETNEVSLSNAKDKSIESRYLIGGPNLAEKPAPFVLFFDGEMLGSLRKKYGIGLIGGNPKVFLENARRQNINVSEMGKEELDEWKRRVEELGREPLITGKDVAKIALFGPFAGVKIPMQVVMGLEFEDYESVVLIFAFMVGAFFKTSIFGALVFPSTFQGKEGMFQYFKNMASEVSIDPISDSNWKSSEKTRKRMTSKASDIEGLEENIWKRLL